LSIWWILGSSPTYLEDPGSQDDYSWKSLSSGYNWGGNSQVNLLGATGNYFDIAEVSLVKSSHQGKIYFPQKESEIIEECYRYYRNCSISASESTQAWMDNLGKCVGGAADGITHSESTNEYNLSSISNLSVRIPQDSSTSLSQIVFSNGSKTDTNYSVRLSETAFTRLYSKIYSTWSSGMHPAIGPGTNSSVADYNSLSNGWGVSGNSNVTNNLTDIVTGMTKHTDSPFETVAGLQQYGWDSETDLTNYFKIAYGHRGWSSPMVSCNYTFASNSSGYAPHPQFYISWSRKSTTQADSGVNGLISYDTEYIWNETE